MLPVDGSVSSVIVVIPVRGNERTIGVLAARVTAHLDERGGRYGVVFVDDDSDDGSWEQIVQAAAAPHVGGLRLGSRCGQMAAIMEGVRSTSSDHIVCIDADIECPPEQISRMVARLDDGADLVSAVRLGTDLRPVHRQLGYHGVRASVDPASRRALVDITSGFKAWRRTVSEPLLADWDRTYLSFIERMVGNARRIDNVEVPWTPSGERSSYRVNVVAAILRDVVVLRIARADLRALVATSAAGAALAGGHRGRRATSATGALSLAAASGIAGAAAALIARRAAAHQARRTQARAQVEVPVVVARVGEIVGG